MQEVFIADFIRSPFSRSRPSEPERDVFNAIRMDDVLSQLLRELVKRNGIDASKVGDVITGCALQVGENWLYGGRHPVLLAGFPVSVSSAAIDRACSSSMNAIMMGALEITSGYSDIVIAGGLEHMTHVPMSNNPHIEPNVRLLVRPEYMKYQMATGYSMGLTAEKLAEKEGFGRQEMDELALRSHRLASASLEDGWFKGEIMPVKTTVEGNEVTVAKDQSIRKDTSIEQLSSLKAAFKEGGVITAGNSAPLNAGASAVLLMSERSVKEAGIKPLARIASMGWAGVEPDLMGKGPVPASRKALDHAGLRPEDIDLWEINEAFAVVVLYAVRELGLDIKRVNIHGGGMAIGHPLGATGARITGTLARELNEGEKEKGVATLCVGGGQGFSIVLERV
ncbi:MAG: acetyl-CoA C-acetyltransferase [Methanomassiliicoccales archaeon]